MGLYLTPRELAQTEPADEKAFRSPVPTQIVSNGEFNPMPQTAQQRAVEAGVKEIAAANAARLGMSRRGFLQTSCGMAAAFLAMNQVFGPLFEVSPAEAAHPDAAAARAAATAAQFVFDDQVHFVREDFREEGLLGLGKYASEHWNPAML
jgi:hypothetical protein